jgi:hypothetical protein
MTTEQERYEAIRTILSLTVLPLLKKERRLMVAVLRIQIASIAVMVLLGVVIALEIFKS